MGVFHFFKKLYNWYQIAQRITHYILHKTSPITYNPRTYSSITRLSKNLIKFGIIHLVSMGNFQKN